jgi:hypothetical protein
MLKRTGKNQPTKRRRLMEELFAEDDMEEEDELDSLHKDDSDSDSEEEQKYQPYRQPNKERNHVKGHKRLMSDYFNDNLTYNDQDFKRRFRMRKELFFKIIADVESSFPYFVQKPV